MKGHIGGAREAAAPIVPRQKWTPEQNDALRRLYPNTPMPKLIEALSKTASAIYQRARALGLVRSQEYLESEYAGRLRSRNNAGLKQQFKKGHATWNAGMKGWKAGGKSAETRFKPGTLNGKAAELLQPIGAERITKDGIRQRKVSNDGPAKRRWRACHSILWEEHHGPVPHGCIVVFRDRDPSRIEIDNLEMITRAENMRRNTIHRYPPELKEVLLLQKKLERAIRSRVDEEQNDRPA